MDINTTLVRVNQEQSEDVSEVSRKMRWLGKGVVPKPSHFQSTKCEYIAIEGLRTQLSS